MNLWPALDNQVKSIRKACAVALRRRRLLRPSVARHSKEGLRSYRPRPPSALEGFAEKIAISVM